MGVGWRAVPGGPLRRVWARAVGRGCGLPVGRGSWLVGCGSWLAPLGFGRWRWAAVGGLLWRVVGCWLRPVGRGWRASVVGCGVGLRAVGCGSCPEWPSAGRGCVLWACGQQVVAPWSCFRLIMCFTISSSLFSVSTLSKVVYQ